MPNIFGLTTRPGLAYGREISEHLGLRLKLVPDFPGSQVLGANFTQISQMKGNPLLERSLVSIYDFVFLKSAFDNEERVIEDPICQ